MNVSKLPVYENGVVEYPGILRSVSRTPRLQNSANRLFSTALFLSAQPGPAATVARRLVRSREDGFDCVESLAELRALGDLLMGLGCSHRRRCLLVLRGA